MDYKNRSNTSCTYDAFERAGLPVNDKMLNGITADETIALLEQNGYKVFRNCEIEIPEDEGFFIFRDWGKDFSHLEYHINFDGVSEYQPESIGAVAIKK